MAVTTSNEKPTILNLPIGLHATGLRREFDSLGDVEVPADRYWGAQTQRSLEHFNIGHDRMPKEVYHAYGYVKKAAAIVNFGTLSLGMPAESRYTEQPVQTASTGMISWSSRLAPRKGQLRTSAGYRSLTEHDRVAERER
jgi:Lyase